MPNIDVTYTFINGTRSDATEVNTNFQDIISGLTDGAHDISMNHIDVNTIDVIGSASFASVRAQENLFVGLSSLRSWYTIHDPMQIGNAGAITSTNVWWRLAETTIYLNCYRGESGGNFTFINAGQAAALELNAQGEIHLKVPGATGMAGESRAFMSALVAYPEGQVSLGRLASDPDPKQGAIYYNTSTNKFRQSDGSSWTDIAAGAGTGETGLPGATGVQGETGRTGPMGMPGVTGLRGFTGPQGKGETGLIGETGLMGPQGETGIRGHTGSQGQTGAQGVTGMDAEYAQNFLHFKWGVYHEGIDVYITDLSYSSRRELFDGLERRLLINLDSVDDPAITEIIETGSVLRIKKLSDPSVYNYIIVTEAEGKAGNTWLYKFRHIAYDYGYSIEIKGDGGPTYDEDYVLEVVNPPEVTRVPATSLQFNFGAGGGTKPKLYGNFPHNPDSGDFEDLNLIVIEARNDEFDFLNPLVDRYERVVDFYSLLPLGTLLRVELNSDPSKFFFALINAVGYGPTHQDGVFAVALDASYVVKNLGEVTGDVSSWYDQDVNVSIIQDPFTMQGETGPQGVTGAYGGPPGETGTQGIQGATGVQGIQGVTGLIGATGVQGPQGETGAQGETGSVGATGIKGATGVQGATGTQGIQGDTGAQGETGAVGATGLIGPQGETGSKGLTGSQGETGVQGTQGDTGVQGIQGETGSQGETGAQGIQGTQGETGLKGDIGSQGDTGAQGLQGETGLIGPNGATGIQGVQGDTGAQGIQGDKGDKGDTGLQGAHGETGPQGLQGDIGPQGETGTQGIQGETGVQGIQGPEGATGAQGIQGETGTQGIQGETGVAGVAGATGVQGDQGLQGDIGPQGETGTQGLQGDIGLQGETGVAGMDASTTGVININMSGGAVEVATGLQSEFQLPGNINIYRWEITGTPTGTLFTQILRDKPSTVYPPTTVIGATGPHLSLQSYNGSDVTYTGSHGDLIRVNVMSCTGVNFANIAFYYSR